MKYELAKELKDAGFPQKGSYAYVRTDYSDGKESYDIRNIDGVHAAIKSRINLMAYVPTLEELIELLPKSRDFALHELTNGKYSASCLAHNPDTQIVFGSNRITEIGVYPTEAVAHLWLVVNKKL